VARNEWLRQGRQLEMGARMVRNIRSLWPARAGASLLRPHLRPAEWPTLQGRRRPTCKREVSRARPPASGVRGASLRWAAIGGAKELAGSSGCRLRAQSRPRLQVMIHQGFWRAAVAPPGGGGRAPGFAPSESRWGRSCSGGGLRRRRRERRALRRTQTPTSQPSNPTNLGRFIS